MKFTPLIVGNMSGGLGALVASHNRYGTYFREGAIPVNPASTRQDAARILFAQMVNRWGTPAMQTNQAGWELYAKNVTVKDRNGAAQNLTGMSMYIRNACVVYQARQDYLTVAPTVMTLPEVDPAAVATISAATQLISVAFNNTLPWAVEDGGDLCVAMGSPQGTSINFFKGPWRHAGVIAGHTAGAPTSPGTVAVPFPVTVGEKVWVKFRVVRADGRVSEPFQRNCIVGA